MTWNFSHWRIAWLCFSECWLQVPEDLLGFVALQSVPLQLIRNPCYICSAHKGELYRICPCKGCTQVSVLLLGINDQQNSFLFSFFLIKGWLVYRWMNSLKTLTPEPWVQFNIIAYSTLQLLHATSWQELLKEGRKALNYLTLELGNFPGYKQNFFRVAYFPLTPIPCCTCPSWDIINVI